MDPNEKRPANPLKYAWPLPLFVASIVFLALAERTIPRPALFQYLFPISYLLWISVMAAFALSLKFLGKQRKQIPRWIFVCNALLGFGGPIVAFTGGIISFYHDH